MALSAERRDVDRRAGELAEPVVGRRIEPHDIRVTLEQRHEGQEERPIEPVTIELVRRHVGGGDQHQPGLEQLLEQPRQDHRVGDILHLEFVEAEKLGFAHDRRGDGRDRIAAAGLLAVGVDALMHFAHEFVEVDAALRHGGGEGEELVHQHGLAAADLAVDVEPPGWRGAACEQPAERAGLGGEPLLAEPPVEVVETRRQAHLRGIVADRAGRRQSA